MPIAHTISCMECGETAVLVQVPADDEIIEAGDILVYHCPDADASRPAPLRSKKVVSGPSCSYASASCTIVVVSSSKRTRKVMRRPYDEPLVDR